MLTHFINKHQLPNDFIETAVKWFIPLAQQIANAQQLSIQSLFIGINGCQGSGKSTLVSFLKDYIEQEFNLTVVSISLDDFYLSKAHRLMLAEKVHPMLATRGVPGTHNIELLNSVIRKLQNGDPVDLPRFDKASDNPKPKSEWRHIDIKADIVLFEGWCWGIMPQTESELISPCNNLEKIKDFDGSWRKFVNKAITINYQPLYQKFDKWLMLKAPSFEQVFAWRWQQEEKLHLKTSKEPNADNTGLMSKSDVYEFIEYFQRLTEHGLATLPQCSDVVFTLSTERKIINVEGTV